MTLRRMIWLNPQSHLWFVNKFTLSVIIFAKIIYFVIILLSQTVVRTLSRQPFFYAVRYSFPPFYIFPGNRKTRRTEVLRVSYVWTQCYLAITIYIILSANQWLLDDRSNTAWSYSTSTFTFVRFVKSHYFLWFPCPYCLVLWIFQAIFLFSAFFSIKMVS